MTSPICRLAPSPTGYLHLGNARTFLIAWLSARRHSGTVILRIEDIDAGRVKPGYAEAQLADLEWLGLDWDAGPIYQTERIPLYESALEKLKRIEAVYPCRCTRKEIERLASAPHAGDEGPAYPGTCSYRRVADAEKLGAPFAWRLRFGDSRPFDDLIRGPNGVDAKSNGGDFVVWRERTPSYQLAVAVDDAAMGVTEVIRGDDLIASTPRQLKLFELLELGPPPRYGHVPLVLDAAGRRMAKRDDSTRLSNLRNSGVKAEELIGRLAHSCGWLPKPEPIAARDLIPLFDLRTIPKDPVTL